MNNEFHRLLTVTNRSIYLEALIIAYIRKQILLRVEKITHEQIDELKKANPHLIQHQISSWADTDVFSNVNEKDILIVKNSYNPKEPYKITFTKIEDTDA